MVADDRIAVDELDQWIEVKIYNKKSNKHGIQYQDY